MGGSGGSYSNSDLKHLEDVAKKKLSQNAEGNPHVFISFAYEDLDAVNMLRGQAKNDKMAVEFDDYSVKEGFDSKNSEYIKTQIRNQIDHSSVTVVYLSNKTADSKWVNWEIEESIKRGKGVIGVYSGDINPVKVPPAFSRNRCKVVKWSQKDLPKAIEDARQNR